MATVGPLLGSVPEEVGPLRPYAILGGGLIFATVPDPTQVLRAAGSALFEGREVACRLRAHRLTESRIP